MKERSTQFSKSFTNRSESISKQLVFNPFIQLKTFSFTIYRLDFHHIHRENSLIYKMADQLIFIYPVFNS